ncbi:MAG: cysteine desulfurase [Chthonomonadaceae bacterium]|nr:cysteine desulfurase [Chthonomonadaceae bacterium]
MQLPIYLDHAATTPVRPEVIEAMMPYFTEAYGNPSTLYSVGMSAREAVEDAREAIAETLNATPEEIVFTSGGTEANNSAIRGIAEYAGKGHLITTNFEHHAVLDPMEKLEHEGFALTVLPVDREGMVTAQQVADAIRPDTILVSVMHANNEIGTIQPIAEIGALCRERGIVFHTDAVQTFGKLPLDVREQKIDLLSISGHKLYAPKGVGALYVRRGTRLSRFMEGGQQEKGRRGGTLNVPGIVGLGKATLIAREEMASEATRLTALREIFLSQLLSAIPDLKVNGSRTHRLPYNLNLCFPGVEGESVLLALDAMGICAAAGSACTTGSVKPSHVLTAIGLSSDEARSALRLTLGKSTDGGAVEYAAEQIRQIVQGLRSLGQRKQPASV